MIRTKPRPLTVQQFLTPAQLKLPSPALVLAIKVPKLELVELPETQRVYQFKKDRKWVRMAVAGRYFHATVLEPAAWAQENLERLDLTWRNNIGAEPSLVETSQYFTHLEELLAASCNHSFRDLAPGLYPIDPEYAPKLTVERLPASLDDLITWESGYDRANGALNRWGLYVVGGER